MVGTAESFAFMFLRMLSLYRFNMHCQFFTGSVSECSTTFNSTLHVSYDDCSAPADNFLNILFCCLIYLPLSYSDAKPQMMNQMCSGCR